MSRSLQHISILILVLFPASAPAQRRGGTATLVGTLSVTAKEGTKLPESFAVVLYRADRTEFGRQPVANHGTYRFSGVANGDYEIAVEAEGRALGRTQININTTRDAEVTKDLELAWREKAGPAPAGAISTLEVYKRSPENQTLMSQASAARAKKNYAEATKLLRQAVGVDAKDFEAWTELGNLLFAQGKTDEAETAFKKALEERPTYAVALLNLGKMNFARKQFDAAITVLDQLVSSHPESAEAHRFLGEAYLRVKKGSKAVPELEEAARLDPDGQAEAHLSLAALYDAAGLKDRAVAEYESFLAQKPAYPDKKKLEKYIQDNKK